MTEPAGYLLDKVEASGAKVEKIDCDGPLVRIMLAGEGDGMITQRLSRRLRPFLLFWAWRQRMLTLFPGRERKEKVPVPDGILKDKVPKGKNYGEEEKDKISLQEERRLFYVGMTRARKLLYLTWARDYGLKRLKKVSPFVLEAFDLAKMPDEFLKTSALEEIRRYEAPASRPEIIPAVKERGILSLSYFQVEDYLTCPLKYRYRHIMRIPVLPHHNLVFGRVLHNTIHFYLKERMSGKRMTEKEFLSDSIHFVLQRLDFFLFCIKL